MGVRHGERRLPGTRLLLAVSLGVTLAWRRGDLARLDVPAPAYALLAVLQLAVRRIHADRRRVALP